MRQSKKDIRGYVYLLLLMTWKEDRNLESEP